VSKGINRT